MRALLVRLGALGTIVVLGWIAMAHAQRGGDGVTGEEPAGGGATSNDLRDAQPVPARPARDANPLRTPALKPPSATGQTEPTPRDPLSDPFGPSSRYVAVPAGAEIPAAGPALMPDNPSRPADDRYGPGSAGLDRVADRRGDRYAAPPATASARPEPAPFRPDPFAAPASPMRPDRSAPGALPGNGFATEVPMETEGTGQPGDQQLEGVQSPQLTIQKSGPKEIQVGKPAAFRVTVRNTGPVPASEVEVRDQVPRGTRLLGATPEAKRGTRGELIWTLGTIRPGEEAVVEMQLMPTAEGEIGSVATVHFGADASARSVATRPQLAIETAAPAKVLIGEQMTLFDRDFQSGDGDRHRRGVGGADSARLAASGRQ